MLGDKILKTRTITLPDDLDKEIGQAAKARGVGFSEWLRDAAMKELHDKTLLRILARRPRPLEELLQHALALKKLESRKVSK